MIIIAFNIYFVIRIPFEIEDTISNSELIKAIIL